MSVPRTTAHLRLAGLFSRLRGRSEQALVNISRLSGEMSEEGWDSLSSRGKASSRGEGELEGWQGQRQVSSWDGGVRFGRTGAGWSVLMCVLDAEAWV